MSASTGAGPRRTRVAVVTPYYPPALGGVERYAARTVRALTESSRHDPVVITTRRGLRTTVDTVRGVPVVRLGTWAVLSNSPVSPLWGWQVPRWLRRLDVDVVNAHAPVPFLADVTTFVAGKRPVVLTYHAGTLVKGGARVDPLLRIYERFVLPRVFRRAADLIAVSPASSNHRFGAHEIPGGVDLDRFTPPERYATGRLLYVGRIERSSRWKGLHVLLAAMPAILAAFPGVRLDVVGTGDAVEDLRAQSRLLGIETSVHWHAELHGSDLVRAYRDSSVLVLPSLTDAENSPLVVMEAMACGLPVVATRAGGVPYMVRSEVDGLLVEPGDAEALAEGCIRLLTDPGLAQGMGREGRANAEERWAWPRQTQKIISVLDHAAAAYPDVRDRSRATRARRPPPR